MELDLMDGILLIFFGFFGSFINAIVGGGALITLPALMFVGLSPASAIATNKLAASMGNLTSSLTFFKAGKIDLKLIGPLLPFVFLLSMLGAWTVHLIDAEILRPLIIVMLILVLIYTWLKKDFGQDGKEKEITKKRKMISIICILTIGFYDGFFGPGVGSFLIFAFVLMGLDFLKASGNAKLINLTSNLAALSMFLYLGQVQLIYGLVMGLSMIIGAYTGSRFALSKGITFVRIVFIVTTILLISKNIYDFFNMA